MAQFNVNPPSRPCLPWRRTPPGPIALPSARLLPYIDSHASASTFPLQPSDTARRPSIRPSPAAGARPARLCGWLCGRAAAGLPAGAGLRAMGSGRAGHGHPARFRLRHPGGGRVGAPRAPSAPDRRRGRADGGHRFCFWCGQQLLAPAADCLYRHAQSQLGRRQRVPAAGARAPAEAAEGDARTALFARYTLLGSLCAALGALAAAWPAHIAAATGLSALDSLRCMFVLYGAVGCAVWLLYRRLPPPHAASPAPRVPLGASRPTVVRLAGLFCVDSFAGGLVVNALMALWLFQRFDMALAAAGQFFFWTGLCAAASQLAAPPLARRIGLINTMVFTHIPASLCLIAAAFSPSMHFA